MGEMGACWTASAELPRDCSSFSEYWDPSGLGLGEGFDKIDDCCSYFILWTRVFKIDVIFSVVPIRD